MGHFKYASRFLGCIKHLLEWLFLRLLSAIMLYFFVSVYNEGHYFWHFPLWSTTDFVFCHQVCSSSAPFLPLYLCTFIDIALILKGVAVKSVPLACHDTYNSCSILVECSPLRYILNTYNQLSASVRKEGRQFKMDDYGASLHNLSGPEILFSSILSLLWCEYMTTALRSKWVKIRYRYLFLFCREIKNVCELWFDFSVSSTQRSAPRSIFWLP